MEWLFKYPWDVWRQGRFVWLSRVPVELRLLLLLAGAAFCWWLYRRASSKVRPGSRRVLLGLRVGALAIVVFLLGMPALRLVKPLANAVFTAVLVDTSRSMSIEDAGGKRSRIAAARDLLGGKDGVLAALSARSRVVSYGFDGDLRRLADPAKADAGGSSTNLFRAVRDLEAELRAVPLAGVVLLTDGGVNAGGRAEEAARILEARGVPLFVVGLGDPSPPRDYEVVRVFAPPRVRRNTEVEVSVTVRHTGFREPFDLVLSRGDSELIRRRIEPSREGDLRQVKFPFTPDHEGTSTYRVSVPRAEGEAVPENNSREFALDITDSRLPVLYLEGSPRMEYRFLRRALYRDPDFRVVGLLRLAKDRFYVQDAGAGEEFLHKGFPQTKEQLYGFQALILGDIEASHFTPAQLQLVEEFVRERGGGLLMLGGVNSFGLGKYADTGLAKLLPVEVGAKDGPYSDEQVRPRPAADGLKHPILHQSADPVQNARLWAAAPPLIGLTPVRGLKAGATLLLAQEKTDRPVLAVQSYGAGRAGAFTSGGSWYWQVSMPASDEFHERFWKQLVRWLAIGAREQVTVGLNAEIYARHEPVILRATVLDRNLQPSNDARVVATFLNPKGNKEEIALDWILSEEGVFVGRYIPEEEGSYAVEVRVEGWPTRPARAGFMVAPPLVEFSEAGLKEASLGEMARIARGRYFRLDEAGGLAEAAGRAVQAVKDADAVTEDRELWDMPFLLILLLGLAGAEWMIRRRCGLA